MRAVTPRAARPDVDADVLLERHEGDPGLGEGVEDGHDLTQRPAEPGEFAHDQAVAALQDARQLVESPAFLGRLSGGGRLDEVVDAEVVRSRVLEDGEALAAHVLLRGRLPPPPVSRARRPARGHPRA